MRARTVYEENANFRRGSSRDDIKTTLLGFRPGQLVTPLDKIDKKYMSMSQPIGAITRIFEGKYMDAHIFGFGYIYYPNNGNSYFEGMSGISGTISLLKNLRSLTEEEAEMVLSYINNPDNKSWFESIKRYFAMKTGGKYTDFFI